MADMKINPDELKEKLEPVGDAFAKAGKAVAKKAEPAVKAVGEKAKESQKLVGDKAREAGKAASDKAREAGKAAGDKVKEAGKAAGDKARAGQKMAQAKAKEAGREAVSAVTPMVYIQYGDKEIVCDELIERVRADYKANNKGTVRSVKLYVKPEENTAYYVINGKEGKIDI